MQIISSLLLLLLLTSCYEVERNCADFRIGTFKFEAVSGTEVYTTRIERNDSIEIEYYKESIDTASIRWINDCEYVLRKLNPKSMAEEKAIHIKILTTKGNAYTFEFNEVGKSSKSRASAVKTSN
ncbi:MAG: DNA topoisomerase IV [Flavobacteriaceae bacterium]|nr:DNA topoisomerase IV [Flavobacteriaceae bacterium]NNK55022.1 DNA topoisomerase IV [Flavobacteriaceae bacterium]NNM09227.1 DNA topoisomerase IV [Flavobacteriaceae bacterium]